jgi:hypothetical protein
MSTGAKPRKLKTTTRRVSVPKRKARLHVVSPASAEEIQRSLGITKHDVAVAHASLRALGYID